MLYHNKMSHDSAHISEISENLQTIKLPHEKCTIEGEKPLDFHQEIVEKLGKFDETKDTLPSYISKVVHCVHTSDKYDKLVQVDITLQIIKKEVDIKEDQEAGVKQQIIDTFVLITEGEVKKELHDVVEKIPKGCCVIA